VLLTLVRLKAQKTDILLTVNVPHIAGQYEAGSVDLEQGKTGNLIAQAEKWTRELLSTFEVRDWELFEAD
jgi:hypothetical protein